MPKVRVKDHRPNLGNRKVLLWNKLMNNNLLVYKIEEQNRNHFVVVSSDEVVEKLLTSKIKEAFRREDFEILTPPQFNAERTVVIRNIDPIITEVDIEELKNDVERRNEWAKITEMIKIPNMPKILKIKFENATMTKAACEKGLLIYNQSVPPANVEKDIFVNITPCFKCYKYNHKTDDCLTPDAILCSECSANTHTFRNCTSETKKCLNCQGNHRTFAARCPIRKNLIKEKKKEIRERSRSRSRTRNAADTMSYAQALQRETQGTSDSVMASFNRTDFVKITSAITYAHIMEGVVPGSFHENVAEMYRINGLPEVKFPDYIPPPHIPLSEITERRKEVEKRSERQEEAAYEEEEEIVIEDKEAEREKRKREQITPSPKEIRDTRQKKKERRQENEDQEEVPPCPPMSPQIGATTMKASTSKELSETVKMREQSTKPKQAKQVSHQEEEILKKYSKFIKEMNFMFIKTRDTTIKRGDVREIEQLLSEGKLKYVYSNASYSEADARAIWENGYVDSGVVEFREVNTDFFNSVERNGQLIRSRRSSLGNVTR